jgi:hypothetical protein
MAAAAKISSGLFVRLRIVRKSLLDNKLTKIYSSNWLQILKI